MMSEEMVTITKKEYDSLVEDSKFLEKLRVAGVDNWQGYEYAFWDDEEFEAEFG